MSGLALQVPDALVDAIAHRVVELLREDQAPANGDTGSLLTVPEAATYLRCAPQRIYDLVSAGRLDVERDGRRVLIRRSALDRHLGGAS